MAKKIATNYYSENAATFHKGESQCDFELQFFRHVLRNSPDNVDVLKRQVELLAGRGEHYAAVLLDLRLVRLQPRDCVVHYNLACSLAMIGFKAAALRTLEEAFELGYDDLAHLAMDPDLDPLRDDPKFREMMYQFGCVA